MWDARLAFIFSLIAAALSLIGTLSQHGYF